VNELVAGQGGSWTEPAAAILSRGRGSRTVLLQALLDALGIRSRVALVRDFGRDPGPFRFPRPDLWAYAILRVEVGGRELWLDPTTRGTPFGVLPASTRDCAALVLPYPGEPEPRRVKLTAVLDAEGGATVEGREEYVGFEASSLRASLERLDPSARRQAAEGGLSRSFPGPALLDLAVEGEKDAEAPVVLRWKVRVERWARLAGDRAVVDAPLFPARMGARFVQRTVRETPLLVAADERTMLEVEVTPPAGFRAVPGAALDVPSAWGRYTRADRTTSGRLLRSDGWELRRARVPPGEFAGFARFASEVDGAQGEPMVFERVTPGDASPGAAGG
jgi:cellulose synthase operon protein C